MLLAITERVRSMVGMELMLNSLLTTLMVS